MLQAGKTPQFCQKYYLSYKGVCVCVCVCNVCCSYFVTYYFVTSLITRYHYHPVFVKHFFTLQCTYLFNLPPLVHLALMHADSIREQLKKLLRRFNVRMISSEGTLY